tara:strand:- start:153 stop:320 length:168 start_codon:yes stop_codon:yes gene_type:complete
VKVEPLQEVEVVIEMVTITLLLRVVVETEGQVQREMRQKTVMPILAAVAVAVLVT